MSSQRHLLTLAAATGIACPAVAQTGFPAAPLRTSDSSLEHRARRVSNESADPLVLASPKTELHRIVSRPPGMQDSLRVVEAFVASASHGLTPEQQAEAFAEQAVKYGSGFDPSNARHRRISEEAKDALRAAFLAAQDGRDGSTKLTSGVILTDAQLLSVLQDAQVILSTQNINREGGTASGGWNLGTREDGTVGNTFRIDIDHRNIGLLTRHFRSIDEAISFAVLHEMGHAIDAKYGEDMPSEDVANYYALAFGREVGLRMPTNSEVTDGAGYSIWPY